MCEDLAGRAPRHLLNIRGNNSWADLKHGHPLHLTASLRTSPAASPLRMTSARLPARRTNPRLWDEPSTNLLLLLLCVLLLRLLHLFPVLFLLFCLTDFFLLRMGTKWVVH